MKELKQITAPELNNPNYANNIADAFKSINENFNILANSDFVKGVSGESVYIETVHYIYNPNDNDSMGFKIRNAMIKAISENKSNEAIADINLSDDSVIHYYDSLNDITVYLLYMAIPSDSENVSKKYIGSLPYVYKDSRFNPIKYEQEESYKTKEDLSCTLMLQQPQLSAVDPDFVFERYTDAPTLYYDSDVNAFCWLINGQKTGLIANGPSGDNGKDATIYIVRTLDPVIAGDDYVVGQVWEYTETNYGWKDINTDEDKYDKSTAIVFSGGTSTMDGNTITDRYWMSTMKRYPVQPGEENEKKYEYKVTCDNGNAITSTFKIDALSKIMSRIDSQSTELGVDKALFIPFNRDPEKTESEGNAHMIYSDGGATLKISPKNSILELNQKSASEAEGYRAMDSKLILDYDFISEGVDTVSILGGGGSHAEGYNSIALGSGSHAEGGAYTKYNGEEYQQLLLAWGKEPGKYQISYGSFSHAEGFGCLSEGDYSHAEGLGSHAENVGSHAEGSSTTASGQYSHAEGKETIASGQYSHAEGKETTASGEASHAEGSNTVAYGITSHAEGGNTIASGQYSHAEGYNTNAMGNYSHAEGMTVDRIESDLSINDSYITLSDDKLTIVSKSKWFDELPMGEVDMPKYIFETPQIIKISNKNGDTAACIQLISNTGMGMCSVDSNGAQKRSSCTTQYNIKWLSDKILLRGGFVIYSISGAIGDYSHAEGYNTKASGDRSHAEGDSTTASGYGSHAEGDSTTASGDGSHTEGQNTTASGQNSHAEGRYTSAGGAASHAEGQYTQTYQQGEHAEGTYNKSYNSTSTDVRVIHSVGVGSSTSARKNAHEIKYNGDHYVYGIGGFDGTNSNIADTLQEVINPKISDIRLFQRLDIDSNTPYTFTADDAKLNIIRMNVEYSNNKCAYFNINNDFLNAFKTIIDKKGGYASIKVIMDNSGTAYIALKLNGNKYDTDGNGAKWGDTCSNSLEDNGVIFKIGTNIPDLGGDTGARQFGLYGIINIEGTRIDYDNRTRYLITVLFDRLGKSVQDIA